MLKSDDVPCPTEEAVPGKMPVEDTSFYTLHGEGQDRINCDVYIRQDLKMDVPLGKTKWILMYYYVAAFLSRIILAQKESPGIIYDIKYQ